MTDLQLLLSIGIPSLLIALAMSSGNSRFNSMDKRMDDMNDRIKKMDADHRQELVTIRADIRDFRAEHRQYLVAIHEALKQFYVMTTKLEGRHRRRPRRPHGRNLQALAPPLSRLLLTHQTRALTKSV